MPRYLVTTAHDIGCGEIEVGARSPAEAKRLARQNASRLGTLGMFTIVGVRKVGDTHIKQD